MDRKPIGKKLEELRNAAVMPRRFAAGRIGMTAMTIFRIENGTQKATLETLEKLCKLYGVELKDILDETESGAKAES